MKNLAYEAKLNKNIGLNNLKAFFNNAVKNNLPAVLWHSPNEKKSFALTSFSEINNKDVDFNNFKGFVFSDFSGKNNLLINADLVVDETGLAVISTDSKKSEAFLKKLNCESKENIYFKNDLINDINYTKDEYIDLVEKTIDFIKSGESQKIVTSRTKKVNFNHGFNLIEIFNSLVQKYNSAFVSLISIPNVGTWIGASPEILLKIKDQKLTTMSLAGTQIYKGQPLEEVEWGLKEKEEQSMVTEYIEKAFIDSGAENYKKSNNKTAIAGNVLHIQTMFEYKSDKINEFANKFLKNLPPTPAVCGLPKDISKKFILGNEIHNREFYSGFLGAVNINEKTELFVNLRCMQIKDNYSLIYVGGGITADSVPEKEWYETELKSRTLLSVINNEL